MRDMSPGFFAGPAAAIDLPRLSGSRPMAYAVAPEHRRFDLRASANADTAELDIYDDIGWWGVSAEMVREKLRSTAAGNIIVRINSRGGDVFDGIAIHNDLVAHPAKVTVIVTGFAASSASLIAMAGDEIQVPSNAFLMIHNAWTYASGNKELFLRVVADLAQVDAALARTYAQRSGLDVAEIGAMMDAETWLDGPTAVAKGFATAAPKIEEGQSVQARLDLSMYRHVPAAVQARFGLAQQAATAPQPAPAPNHSAFQAELARLNSFTASLRV